MEEFIFAGITMMGLGTLIWIGKRLNEDNNNEFFK